MIDEEARACWTVQALGTWSIALMGAEWAGGERDSNVSRWICGGTTLVDGIRIFVYVSCFLIHQYPLMYRLYHRDDDDLLSDEQTSRLIDRTLQSTCDGLHLRYNSESTLELKSSR